jgi:predicted nuclease of restriction endonuclease-like RecB superfamily
MPARVPAAWESVLTKDLLRVSRAGGGYHPQFVGDDDEARDLAARVLGVYQGHVGEPRGDLDAALTDLERDASDFKLVRGFAKLLDREAAFETRAGVEPRRAREAAFRAAEEVGVVTESERETALGRAAERLDADAETVEEALYADLEERQVLTTFDPRYDPDTLVEQYDLSLAQTALFDATAVRVRSTEPKELISAVKRLRLMYEVLRVDAADRGAGPGDREVVVTGPSAPFSRSRRYGTRFARLLRTVATAPDWRLEATVDDRGTERQLVLTAGDISVPGTEPVVEPTYDSGVERDFATRFAALDLDWELVREPEPLAAGAHVVIPDFAFDYRHGGGDGDRPFRVFFEVMGFWTPEYVAKKLSRLADLEDVEMLVAVDESLGVGEEVAELTDGAIPYRGSVRVKDVVDALRTYEDELLADAAAELPAELVPDDDVVTIETLAERHGVGEAAIEGKSFPEHERVGRTLVRPGVLDAVAERVEAGIELAEAEAVLDEFGLDDASAVLAELGYRVEWDGLSGGTVRER